MNSENRIRRAIRCALFTSAAAAAGLTAPAFAQDAPDDAQITGEIVVTGSRIPRANLTAPTQVTTIDAEAIRYSGLGNVADILRAVPSFGVSGLSTNNSNFLTSGGGINTLELRNLDEDRTLVLVNGRRYVSGVAGTAAVDFNTIPVELIDRVEVITGGASAIYGSDALAGVVNVILRDKFEGVEFGYQYGEAPSTNDDINHRINFIAGGSFDEDRGNAMISATFSQQRGVMARDRKETRVDDIATCLFTGVTADCQTPTENFFSSFSEYGRFFVPSTGESFTVSEGTGANGTVVPWDTEQFGFNRQHFRRYSVPTDRFLITGNASYEVGPSIEAFIETTYAQTRTSQELEPYPHADADLNFGIPVDNPFVPQAIRDAVLAAGDDHIEFSRRMTEIGTRGAEADRNTYRFVLGMRGDALDKFRWETYYGLGRMEDSQQGGGQINVSNMREALNAIDGDGDPNTFDPICANEFARLEGCVPINLFGLGSITPEAAAYVRAPTQRQMMTQQEVAGASIGGPLFTLPAGAVDFAFGLEWRRERAEDVPDALTQSGQNAGNVEPPTFGSYDVGEAFIEVEVPLLANLPGVHELSIGGAYRYSDYSTVDTTDAYAARLSWSPFESVRIRGQYARAVRAPNVNELFSPGGENFAPVADPCNNVTATTPGNVAENCRSIPAIAARIAATGSFTLTQPEIQGTAGFTGMGNENLSTETSDSYSLGIVFNDSFPSVGDLTISVDWFSIKIEQLIDTIDRQTSLNLCFNVDPSQFANNPFCALLTRDVDGPAFQLGELTEVNSQFINEGTLETRGVDVSLVWAMPLDVWISENAGNLALRLNYTRLLDFQERKFDTVDKMKGEVGFAEHEAQAALVYQRGPLSLQWEMNYIGDSKPDNDPESLFYFDVGSYNVHDIRVGYDLFENTNIFFGVNNLFDEKAPVILSGVPGNITGTDTNAGVYDPIGRTAYAGARISF